MNHHHLRNALTLLCLFFMCIQPAYCFEDAIIAVVNQETITRKDLQDYITAVYSQLKMDGRHSEAQIKDIMAQVEKEGINRLIDDRLILSAANKIGVQAHRAAIDQRINEIRSRYPSEQIFLSSLAAEGLTVTDLQERIADQLKAQFFVETEIKSTIYVNPQEITDYYQNNIEKFKNPEYADIDSIFIPYTENPDTAREQANTAYGQLKMGQDFENVTQQYSKAPSIKTIVKGQLKPQIEQQIFSLKPGEFTWPIESDQGIFIFKLNKKFAQETAALEDVKDQIAQFLFNQKFKEKTESWLKQEREKTYIEIKGL